MKIHHTKLNNRFCSLTAIYAIDLDVDKLDVLCLICQSGCVKTTTLLIIYCL